MTATRERLADRRTHDLVKIEWGGRRWHVGVGRFTDDRVGEIFIDGGKAGTEVQAMVHDACILVSRLLQMGVTIEEIAASLGREGPDSPDAASIIGAAVKAVAELGRP